MGMEAMGTAAAATMASTAGMYAVNQNMQVSRSMTRSVSDMGYSQAATRPLGGLGGALEATFGSPDTHYDGLYGIE